MSSSFNEDRGKHFENDDDDDELVLDYKSIAHHYNNNNNLLDYDEDLDEISYQDLKEKFYSKYKTSRLQKLNRRKKLPRDEFDDSDDNSCASELTKTDIQKIHQELNLIHNKLVVSKKFQNK